MIPVMERHIPFDNAPNFRDLGGYGTADGRTVRYGRAFRSGALHWMTPAEAAVARDELGIRAVFDLRSVEELAAEGIGLFPVPPVRHLHTPILRHLPAPHQAGTGQKADGKAMAGECPGRAGGGTVVDTSAPADGMIGLYFHMIEKGASNIAGTIDLMAGIEDGAFLFHCAAGKDRTGIIAAVLLGLLGVRREEIVADYILTEEFNDAIMATLTRNEGYAERSKGYSPDAMRAPAARMERTLRFIDDRYGGAREYLVSSGLRPEAIERLKTNLLE